MGRTPRPCCSYAGLNKGPWTPEEDLRLIKYIEAHGQGNWRTLPMKAGLQRCGKGCRLRWMNYLRPNVKRGHISSDEEEMIIRLHKLLGNRWSLIAGRIPGRTDNEVKNYWNTHLRKKFNAIKGIRGCNAQTLCKQHDSDKIYEGGTTAFYINEKDAFCSQNADSNRQMVKDHENKDPGCSHIGEIVSILQGPKELYNWRANAALEAESIENLKHLIDGFHDPAINMDLMNCTINDIHTAWPHGNNHPSTDLPSIYSPEFKPNYEACPSDSVTSVQGHEPRQQIDNIVSANSGHVNNNLPSKTAADPQIHTVPPYGFSTMDEFNLDWDVFDQCSNMVLSEFDQLGAEYPKADQCSEPWLSSFLGFDCMEQLYSSVQNVFPHCKEWLLHY